MPFLGAALYVVGLILLAISVFVTVPRDALFKLGVLCIFLGMLLFGGIPSLPE